MHALMRLFRRALHARGMLVAAPGLISAPIQAAELPGQGIDAGDLISKALFLELGFSFLVGLALGYALKIALRIALLIGGVVLFALFFLQYKGFIQVEWSALEQVHHTWSQWLSAQAGAFFRFIGHHLASATGLLAGLAVGLKL